MTFVPDPDPIGVVYFADADPVFAMAEWLKEPLVIRPEPKTDEYQQTIQQGTEVPQISMACVPLLSHDVTTGTLGFVKYGDREWLEEELNALKTIGLVADDGRVLDTSGSVIAGLTYNFLPFMILPIYASLERLETSLIEAAKDLYSSATTAFRKVTLPLTGPGIVAGVRRVVVLVRLLRVRVQRRVDLAAGDQHRAHHGGEREQRHAGAAPPRRGAGPGPDHRRRP